MSFGWDHWCFDLGEAPVGQDRALWLAYFDEERQENCCCTGIRMHNNSWDKSGVYAWRYLHGPPANPNEVTNLGHMEAEND